MRSTNSAMQQLAPYLGLGVQLAATVVLCGAAGYWVDASFGTSPIGLASGVVVGSVVGMVQFLRTVQTLGAKKSGEDGN